MLELFDGGPPIYDTIEELLEVVSVYWFLG